MKKHLNSDRNYFSWYQGCWEFLRGPRAIVYRHLKLPSDQAWNFKSSNLFSCQVFKDKKCSLLCYQGVSASVCRYNVMLECWQHLPGSRPSFSDLVADLDRILALSSNEVRITHSSYVASKTTHHDILTRVNCESSGDYKVTFDVSFLHFTWHHRNQENLSRSLSLSANDV